MDVHTFQDDGSGMTCDECELGPNHPRHTATTPPAALAAVRTLGDAGGATYSPTRDRAPLSGQRHRVYEVIRDGQWRTDAEVAEITGDPVQSTGSRVRDFRKAEYGRHTVVKRLRAGHTRLYEYRFTHRLAETG